VYTEYLFLYENKLTGTIPDSIGNLNRLEYLSLRENKLNGTIPESIGNLYNLEYLSLSNNKIAGTIPDSIGSLTSLETLYLYNNELSGNIPESIGKLNLNVLELDNNNGNNFTERKNDTTGNPVPVIPDTTRNPKILGISAPVAIGTGISVLLIAAFAVKYFKGAQEENRPSEDP